MSADLLRRAASRLRESAETATRGPWVFYQTITRDRENEFAWTITRSQCANDKGECEPDCGRTVLQTGAEHCEHDAMTAEDAEWITLMHPGLAEPLAAVLEAVADQITAEGIHHDHWRTRGCGRPVSPHGTLVYPTSCVCPAVMRAVDIARAILGEVADER